jgi:hypothetical protein
MSWRLFDAKNNQWFNDELYATREACLSAIDHYTHLAHSEGEVLELLAEPIEAGEAFEDFMDEEQ